MSGWWEFVDLNVLLQFGGSSFYSAHDVVSQGWMNASYKLRHIVM
jgi:hypothetical protein